MKQLLTVLTLLLLVATAWAQNPPRGEVPMGPPNLVDQGFTEAEAKAVQTDLKAWEQTNREWEADLQVIDAQRNRLMVKDNLDRGELEKIIRSQYEFFLKRDLARIDLMVKWRQTYGIEKSRLLDGMLRGPQPDQSRGPGQGQPPGGQTQPGPKKP